MRLLLDTHAMIWMVGEPAMLARPALAALADPDNDRWVSIATIWEIATLSANGRLSFPPSYTEALQRTLTTLLPISLAHVERAASLPFHHRNPFDRLLIAQAMEESLTVVTRDRRFAAYGVAVLPA